MKFLFIGVIGSKSFISKMIKTSSGSPNPAAQKFFRLLFEGIANKSNNAEVEVFCLPEFNSLIDSMEYSEIERDVKYTYLKTYKSIFKRRIFNFFSIQKSVKGTVHDSRMASPIILFDPLNITSSIYSFIISKIYNLRTMGVITDLPEFMNIFKDKITFFDKILMLFRSFFISSSNLHIVLTEGIAERLKLDKGKFIVIESVVDSTRENFRRIYRDRKIIHYSGGLFEKFGVKMLIEAFQKLVSNNLELHLFGKGDLEHYISECCKYDKRIKYFGLKENEIVIQDQKQSYLLVNPRFSHGEYTRYSFPSKTVEYMLAEVPLIMNKLPGVPDEYFKYVYTFQDESLIGYINSLEKYLYLEKSHNEDFGKAAANFVLKHKSKEFQGKKIVDFILNNNEEVYN